MAEPTCVLHPFSYISPAFSTDTIQEGTPICNYGEEEGEGSVSFGRFMSEDLSWERWTSFNNNRNRYVEEAEKYSRPGSVAQKKAYFEAHFKRMAALKAAALLESGVPGTGIGIETGVNNSYNDDESGSCSSFHDVKDFGVNVETVQANEGVEGFVVHQNELYSVGSDNVEVVDEKMVEQSEVLKDEVCVESDKELSENVIAQMEKPSIQLKTSLKEEVSTPMVKKNPPLSSFMSPIDTRTAPLFAPSPAKSTTSAIHPGKENYATPMKNMPSSINADHDHKKRTPLRASINREFNRILSPVIRKIGSSSSKTPKHCSTPLKTPSKGSVNGVPEPPPFTPDLTKRGGRSHHDSSACERKPAAPRWHILSDGFKSPSNNKNKTSSPIIPASFCLRGGERVTRRKQKLEDKFNATTTGKAPQPSKFKEKAEAELNKFRQSFCFKVMSSPDHYTEAESHYKNESTRRESPKRLGRQQNSSTSQSRSSLPPRRPTVKPSGLKNVSQRNSILNN